MNSYLPAFGATPLSAISFAGGFDIQKVRMGFPILDQKVHDKPLVYLDSAATSQKPKAVLDAVTRYYRHDNANVHRGVHRLSERATEAFERARMTVALLHTRSSKSSPAATRSTCPA